MTREAPHGRSRYNNHGCRCLVCTDAQTRYARHYNRRCGDGCAWCNPPDILCTDFPLALVARQAWPDDGTAIATMERAP